jgi:hypothetical protein
MRNPREGEGEFAHTLREALHGARTDDLGSGKVTPHPRTGEVF